MSIRLAGALSSVLTALACAGDPSAESDVADASTVAPPTADASTADASVGDADVAPAAVPGGRASFVASVMGAAYNAAWLRMGTWSFSPSGTVTETYWMWNQLDAPTTTNTTANRARSGYTTSGCPQVCDVWTAKGFEPDAPPQERTGTWTYDDLGQVRIRWPADRSETYRVVERGSYVELALITHDYPEVSTVYAAVFGSHASLSEGATRDQIADAGDLDFTSHVQNWDAVTETSTGTITFAQYHRCAASPTLQGINPAVYHTYFAGDPASDGRKTYWYHQLTVVAQTSHCANIDRGGHTYQLLQILDDDGRFVGWVGGEASLLARRNGASIITHTAIIERLPETD